MMRRIFVDEAIASGQRLSVSGEDGHHLARVLRVREGESLSVAAANGVFSAVVQQVDKAVGVLTIGDVQPRHDPEIAVYLVQALAKGDKMETVIQKGTEVGAVGFVLVQTERSVMQLAKDKAADRTARWQKVAREAASQSQRDAVPTVQYCPDLSAAERWLTARPELSIFTLDEREQTVSLKDALQASKGQTYAIAIGPEGGWSDDERAAWKRMGAVCITLGPRILRTETAGLVAAAAILYEYDELGG
jgi:16S rRNA (uracil1498-N3)-methyltransferase